jgi:RNA polymerase sigma factor (sigma-70 family)
LDLSGKNYFSLVIWNLHRKTYTLSSHFNSMTTLQPTDDTLLLEKIARQEQAALAKLYDRYARVLYALAFKILESVEDTEEVVLDVFCQVWRTASSYNASRGKVDAWLFMLTRSRAIDKLRTLSRRNQNTTVSVDAVPLQLQAATPEPQEEAIIQERRDRVSAALRQLSSEQRQALELAYYQGLTHVEIAAQLGKPTGTIKTRIRLGLVKLHKILGSHL